VAGIFFIVIIDSLYESISIIDSSTSYNAMAACYDGGNWVSKDRLDSRLGPNDATRRLGWQVCF
jgi:hypothetical protein